MYYTDNIACPIYVDFIMAGKIITGMLTIDGGMVENLPNQSTFG